MPELYIYYRAKSANAKTVQARANSMQARLASKHGIASFLKRSPDEKEGFHTWMEVYFNVPAQFDDLLNEAFESVQLKELIEGERRAETFLDLSACA